MSSREFDDPFDDLLRQALQPFAEAKPPRWVWGQIRRRVSTASYSWWSRVLSWFSFFDVLYAPPLSNQPYCVHPYGGFLPAPASGMAMRQILNLRVAS
ncbi:MAG TPA: hypothetical protein PLJ78_05420 [Anaerolineae bacterium]|nr:hypothetical protein [Anaerolineae bacterium]HQK13367.1 hypothetical protein [Anaerolineae bacterium]